MKTKRNIGIIALVVLAICFVAWVMLIVTGACFTDKGGFSVWVPIVFLTFAASGITAFVCLSGDIISFVGKMFSIGFNNGSNPPVSGDVKFCPKCGKRLEADATFCSSCGEKQK